MDSGKCSLSVEQAVSCLMEDPEAFTELKTEVSFPFDGVLGNTFGVAWKGKYFPRLEELGRTNSSTYI